MTPDPALRHNVAMADFWSVADAETAVTPCRDCGDALHAGELRAGMVRCQICDAVEDRAAPTKETAMSVHEFKITVLSSLDTHHGEAMVISDAPGFNGEHFSERYDDDKTAERVAHAITAILWGQGHPAFISGCTCAGWHSSDPLDR